jgi:chromate transport protein ChrA
MMIHIASAIQTFAQGAQEDGTLAGEGLTAIETFTYFFAAPTVLFIAISVLVYALTGDRKKSEKKSSVITTIE